MFDAQTVDLIQSAPPLDGMELTDLPKDLTRAYSTIVSLRMRLRETLTAETYHSELGAIVQRLETLALTQEAFVAATPDRSNRNAAAFVAAAAHQLRFSAETLMGPGHEPSLLAVQAIGSEIAATLMFLIAGRAADAAQMARNVRVDATASVENHLRQAIVDLARGQLENIQTLTWETSPNFDLSAEAATTLLWAELLRGIRALAARLARHTDATALDDETPATVFALVRDMSVESIPFNGTVQVFSVFPGPHHLASLLHSVANVLDDTGVVNIAVPPTVPAGDWRAFLQRLARRRPYLWPNHSAAIAAGYLNPGTSAVVSFPTGAGKSTLAELKIGVARLLNKKVVFLAPTLALVNQVATDVRRTFPETRTTLADELEPEDLTNIAVMTPERCLTLLGFSPNAFDDVGLLVFDECHLMQPRDGSSRRSVDAMLCLLAFLRAVPDADVLLISAMISNAPELARWLNDITGRPVLPLDVNWKPTRQARGCVVYPSERISELGELVKQFARTSNQKSISASVKRQLTVQPMGMFSLLQTWHSQNEEDYTLLRLLDDPVFLDATKRTYPGRQLPDAYLTSNRNAVAAAIASRSGDLGIKTLVFAQTIPFCSSIESQTEESMTSRSVDFTAEELEHFNLAVLELGSDAHTYCRKGSLVASHHGLLLPAERQVNESMFKRENGIHVLVATSTLAQGMNLPSQMVIIAGDDRFDATLNKVTLLEAHELLNAAGRAGRAGEAAEGMVILIPGKVIAYDQLKTTATKHWFDLQGIFSNSDQCLELDDPLQPLLDRIHQSTNSNNAEDAYFLRRLPIKIGEGEESARALLNKSFAAFKSREVGNDDWIRQRIDSAMLRRKVIAATPDVISWEDELAATTGILSSEQIRLVGQRLRETVGEPLGNPAKWIEWGFSWLADNPSSLRDVVRPLTLVGVFGKRYEGLENDVAKTMAVLDTIRRIMPLWIGGTPLNEIERQLTDKPSKKCDSAREWALRLAPELAYFFGTVAQTYRRMREAETGITVDLPLAFAIHGRCVREGFDDPDKLALHQVLGAIVPRVAVHRRFEAIRNDIEPGNDYENFADTVRRLERAHKMRR